MSSSSFLANFAAREWIRTKPKKSHPAASARGMPRNLGLENSAEDAAQRPHDGGDGSDPSHGHRNPPQDAKGPLDAGASIAPLRGDNGRGQTVQVQDRLPLTRAQLHQQIEAQGRALNAALARNEALEIQNKDILEQLSSSFLSNAADRKALQEELRQQCVLSATYHAETAVLESKVQVLMGQLDAVKHENKNLSEAKRGLKAALKAKHAEMTRLHDSYESALEEKLVGIQAYVQQLEDCVRCKALSNPTSSLHGNSPSVVSCLPPTSGTATAVSPQGTYRLKSSLTYDVLGLLSASQKNARIDGLPDGRWCGGVDGDMAEMQLSTIQNVSAATLVLSSPHIDRFESLRWDDVESSRRNEAERDEIAFSSIRRHDQDQGASKPAQRGREFSNLSVAFDTCNPVASEASFTQHADGSGNTFTPRRSPKHDFPTMYSDDPANARIYSPRNASNNGDLFSARQKQARIERHLEREALLQSLDMKLAMPSPRYDEFTQGRVNGQQEARGASGAFKPPLGTSTSPTSPRTLWANTDQELAPADSVTLC